MTEQELTNFANAYIRALTKMEGAKEDLKQACEQACCKSGGIIITEPGWGLKIIPDQKGGIGDFEETPIRGRV